MTGTPPVPAGNTTPYPLQQPGQRGGHAPDGPVIRTPEPSASPSLAVIAAFGVALVAGTAAIALALSDRHSGGD